MPSAAKRRKAAKKKKKRAAAFVSNGSSDGGGENSSPASQDIETDRNPFTKNESKEPFLSTESSVNRSVIENGNDDDTVKPYVNFGGLNESSNRSLSIENVDDGSRVDKVEMEHSKFVVTDPHSFVNNAGLDKVAVTMAAPVVWFESNAVVLDNVIHDNQESVPVPKLLASSVAKKKLKNRDQKVHPSETFLDFKTDTPPLSDTNSEQPFKEIITKQDPKSIIPIDNVVNSEIHQCPEKEPLLQQARRPASKTLWTSCCGLFELFTGSSS